MPIKLFISHISEEGEIAVLLKRIIVRDFENHVNVFASSDGTSIDAGDIWLRALQQAMEEASAFIVLCSKASVHRPWVQFELGGAWLKGVPIIPICHSGMNPDALPTPLSWLQGISLGKADDLKKLYRRLAELIKSPFVPEVRELDKFVARVEELESRPSGVQQFERYIDIMLPPPGQLAGPSIPDDVRIESNEISLDLFGLSANSRPRWRDITQAARKRLDQRWLKELQHCAYLASRNESFRPVQAIYHGERASYQPQLAKREILPDQSCRLHVHLIETTVAPLMEVQNDLGLLATLLRLGLRFRYEVLERYRKRTQGQSMDALEAGRDDLLQQVRHWIEIIEIDALSRGARNIDRDAVASAFATDSDLAEVIELQGVWDRARTLLFNDTPRPSVANMQQAVAQMMELNFRFMYLASRRFHELIQQLWASKNAGLGNRSPELTAMPPAPAPQQSAGAVQ